jgi:uncharacterized protein GlcG (DUF336 family)
MTDAPLAYGPPVTLAYAQALAAAAVAECDRLGLPMVIVVTEPSGDLVLVHKMDQAQYGSTDVAIGKAKTASRFRRPTSVMAAVVKAGTLNSIFSGAMAIEGGEPIIQNGLVTGAIAVSGGTPTEDGDVARAALAAVAKA